MRSFFILFVWVFAIVWLAGAASTFTLCRKQNGGYKFLAFLGSTCLLIGAGGFFASALSGVGGLNLLPNSFEWPIGYSTGVVRTESGMFVVPHSASNRVQIYDPQWNFVRGWYVDAGGGIIKINTADNDRFEVITARGNHKYVYDTTGKLISSETYNPELYSSFPDQGSSYLVPTRPWLWVFSHPFVSGGVAFIGILILNGLDKDRTRTKGEHSDSSAISG
jgi:hypothetical protein